MDTLQAPLLRHLDLCKFHGGGRIPSTINMIVWHQTDDHLSLSDLVRYLNSGDDGLKSYHYWIDFDGVITRLVPWNIVAYHAGKSAWPVGKLGVLPLQSVNKRSIGIVFRGHLHDALTAAQARSGLWLSRELRSIPLEIVYNVGHKEVAPGRRFDPGFDMTWWRNELAQAK